MKAILRGKNDIPLVKGIMGVGGCFMPAYGKTKHRCCGLCRWGIHKAQVYKDEYVYCENPKVTK